MAIAVLKLIANSSYFFVVLPSFGLIHLKLFFATHPQGVNFINVLQAALLWRNPKSAKRQ